MRWISKTSSKIRKTETGICWLWWTEPGCSCLHPIAVEISHRVSRKRLELLLTFEVLLSIRSDAEGEITVHAVKHLCLSLRVSIEDSPSSHLRAQEAVERVGGWLQEVLSELCTSRHRIGDRYVLCACWIQRATTNSSLPSFQTSFRLWFDRDSQAVRLDYARDCVEYKGGLQKQPGLTRRRCRLTYICITFQQYSVGP